VGRHCVGRVRGKRAAGGSLGQGIERPSDYESFDRAVVPGAIGSLVRAVVPGAIGSLVRAVVQGVDGSLG
jgi:hypothetical protein